MKRILSLALLILTVHPTEATVLTTEHIDLSVNFRASLVGSGTNPWRLTVRDEDNRAEYAGVRAMFADPEEVRLRVREEARVQILADPRYSFLGPVGTHTYILPQTQNPALLYAGISTENKTSQSGWQGFGVGPQFLTRGIPGGTFTGNSITLRLVSFTGPGNFHLYSVNQFGDPSIIFNTADGLSFADSRSLAPAIHAHFNWAFSLPGEYEIGLRAFGTLLSGNTYTESDITTFRFEVIPEPGSAALIVFGSFLLAHRRRHFRASARQNRTNHNQP